MGWAGHVASSGEDNCIHFIGKPQGKLQQEQLGIHGGVALNRILKQYDWNGLEWIDWGPGMKGWQALITTAMILQVP
jgi:hypothetical protein